MILWPSIASGLLPQRCALGGGAQDTTFAAVFAFGAGTETPEDNSSASVEREESAEGTQDAQALPVPWMAPPIENIVTPQDDDHTTAAEPADKGLETPRSCLADGDAMVSGAVTSVKVV